MSDSGGEPSPSDLVAPRDPVAPDAAGLAARAGEEAVVAPPIVAPPIAPPPIVADDGARAAVLDDVGNLGEDIPCRECGYNLRGLPLTQSCPECSLPIERSVRSDRLAFANPSWVFRLRRGLLLVIVGVLSTIGVQILGAIGIVVVVGVAMSAATRGGGGAPPPNPLGMPGVVMAIAIASLLAVACTLVTITGVWFFTTPDPAKAEPRPVNARTLARWCYLANVLALPANMVLQSTGNGMGFGGAGGMGIGIGPMFYVASIAATVMGGVTAVGQVAGLIHLRALALRVPRPALAGQARLVAWSYGAALAIASLTGLVVVILMPQVMAAGGMGGPGGGGPGGLGMTPAFGVFFGVSAIGGCLGGLGSMVFGIWALVLLFIFHAAFKKAHAEAVANWVST
jgi:hypothetical protein